MDLQYKYSIFVSVYVTNAKGLHLRMGFFFYK
jgi:hypothetical protein